MHFCVGRYRLLISTLMSQRVFILLKRNRKMRLVTKVYWKYFQKILEETLGSEFFFSNPLKVLYMKERLVFSLIEQKVVSPVGYGVLDAESRPSVHLYNSSQRQDTTIPRQLNCDNLEGVDPWGVAHPFFFSSFFYRTLY